MEQAQGRGQSPSGGVNEPAGSVQYVTQEALAAASHPNQAEQSVADARQWLSHG